MKQFFRFFLALFASTLLLVSCGGSTNTAQSDLKGENADMIVDVNFKNAPSLVKKLESTELLDSVDENTKTKIQEIIPQLKDADIQVAVTAQEEGKEAAHIVASGIGSDIITFAKDIQAGYKDASEVSEEEFMKAMANMQMAENMAGVYAEGKKIGQRLGYEAKNAELSTRDEKVGVNIFDTLGVSSDAISFDVYEEKEQELTGLAKDNAKYSALAKFLTGKEFLAMYVSDSINTNQTPSSVADLDPSAVLWTLTLEDAKISTTLIVETKEAMTDEEKENMKTGVEEINKQIKEADLESGVFAQFAADEEMKAIAQKIKDGASVSYDIKSDTLVTMTLDLPISVDELETALKTVYPLAMMLFMGGL